MGVDWQRLQVLVADDQRFILGLVFHILKEIGLTSEHIHQAADSDEAIKILKSAAVDVVICDVNMGPLNGLGVLKEIRTGHLGTARDLPVILLTAHSDPVTVKAAAQLDANAFIVKPVAKKDLAAKMERVLTGRRPTTDGKTYDAVSSELSGAIKAAAAMDGHQAELLATAKTASPAAAAAPSAAATAPAAAATPVAPPTPGGGLRIAVGGLQEGDSLVEDVVTPNGLVAAKAGVTLSWEDINRLVNILSAYHLGEVTIAPRKSG